MNHFSRHHRGSCHSNKRNSGNDNFQRRNIEDDESRKYLEEGKAANFRKFKQQKKPSKKDHFNNSEDGSGNGSRLQLRRGEMYGSSQSLPGFGNSEIDEKCRKGKHYRKMRDSSLTKESSFYKEQENFIRTDIATSDFGSISSDNSYAHDYISTYDREPRLGDISVFWDIENCPVPKDKSALLIVKKIRDSFYTGFREYEFLVVCDTSKVKSHILEDLNKSSVIVANVNATSKNAADILLKRKLHDFGYRSHPYSRVIVITSDINFVHDLNALHYHKHIEVILIHNYEVNPAMKIAANKSIVYQDFVSDIPNNSYNEEENFFWHILEIGNLPQNVTVNQIKHKLNGLFSSYKGKLAMIEGSLAQIQFNSQSDAYRARDRLQNENVFNSRISISYIYEPKRSLNDKLNNSKLVHADEEKVPMNLMQQCGEEIKQNVDSKSSRISCTLLIWVKKNDDENLLKFKRTLTSFNVEFKQNMYDTGQLSFTVKCASLNLAKKVMKELSKTKCEVKIEMTRMNPKTEISTIQNPQDVLNEEILIKKCNLLEENRIKCEAYKNKIHKLKTLPKKDQFSSFKSNEISILKGRINFLNRCQDEFELALRSLSKSVIESNFGYKDIVDLLHYECLQFRKALPIYGFRQEIIKNVKNNQIFILAGPLGSGKSTQLIQYVYEQNLLGKGKVLCCQPCEQFVLHHGRNVIQQTQQIFGNSFGYVKGCGGKVLHNRQAFYMSDWNLLKESLEDKFLSKYSCIIMDELQENSSSSIFLLDYLKQLLSERKDLCVILVSDCTKVETLSSFFKRCPVVEITYPYFLVEEHDVVISQDYVQQSVQLICDFIDSQKDGDILVILPSPAEVLLGVQLLNKHLVGNVKSNIIPFLLYDNFVPDRLEIMVNRRDGIKYIIFMASCLENAVAFPNVSCVIDSGKKMETISRTTYLVNEFKWVSGTDVAKQRAQRAGISYAGKCFHLMPQKPLKSRSSDYSSEQCNFPFIILHILKKNKNPWHFNYLNHPDFNELQQTMHELSDFGITVDLELTKMGEILIRLPLSFHLSLLFCKSLNENLGDLILPMCVIAEITGSMLPVWNTNEISSTNLFEVMSIYFDWKNRHEKLRETFLDNLKVNSFTIEVIHNKVNEIISILKPLGILLKIKSDCVNEKPKINAFIKKYWHKNLCKQQKPRGRKFTLLKNNETVSFIPKSTGSPDCLHEKLIFESIIKDDISKSILNYVPIDENEMFENISTEQKNMEMEQVSIHPVGQYLLETVMLGNKGKHLHYLEKNLSKKINSSVKISVFLQKAKISVSVSKEYIGVILQELQERLQNNKKIMLNEIFEYPLDSKTGFRILMSKGGTITRLLTTKEFISMFFFLKDKESATDIIKQCETFGTVVHHSVKDVNQKRQLIVIFSDPEGARKAFENLKGNVSVKCRCFTNKLKITGKMQKRIILYWADAVNNGTGVIHLPYDISLCEVADVLILQAKKNKHLCNANICSDPNNRKIILNNLAKTLSQDQLIQEINECLFLGNSNICIRDMDLQLLDQSPLIVSEDDIKRTEMELKKLLELHEDSEKIFVLSPNDQDKMWTAVVSTTLPPDKERALQKLSFNSMPIEFIHKFCSIIFLSEKLFTYYCNHLLPKLQNIIFNVSNIKIYDIGDKKSIMIASQNYSEYLETYSILTKLFEPKVYPIDVNSLPNHMFTENGAGSNFVRTLNDDSTFAFYKDLNQHLVYFGLPAEELKINEFIQKIKTMPLEEEEVIIDCSGKGVIRKLVTLHGFYLEKLDILCESMFKIDFKRKLITVRACEMARKELKTIINTISFDFISEEDSSHIIKNDLEICPICNDFLRFEENYCYRFEYCGHAYCSPCFIAYIVNSTPPIVCLFEGCSCELVYRDMKQLQAKHPRVLEIFIKNGLRQTLKTTTMFAVCPVPDCNGILQHVEAEQTCIYCLNSVCTSCQVFYHYGLSCEDYQRNKNQSLLLE